jgi:hypothetical protein
LPELPTAPFPKIAATYTPFAVAKMVGTTGFALLAAVWGIARLEIADENGRIVAKIA